jgi:glycosyltransferase involved in cell wall biosynthesis
LLLRPFIRLPWVAFAHGWTDEDRRIRAYNRLDFRLLRYPDAVVAVSQDVRRRLEAAGVPSSRITVIPNAVDLPTTAPRLEGGSWRASLGLSPLRPVVSVIGRLSPEKGQDVFLRACGVARRCGTPFTAVLVGEGPSTTSLRAQVEDAGLSPIVRFAGYHSDVSAVYRESDIIVIPSRSEGLPNVLLEAMALGKPVIATNAGGIPEVIRNGVNGVLVPIADPESMARAMSMLLTSAEQRAILGRNAAATAPAFSPSTRAQRILALYDEVTATTASCRRARPVQSSS